MASPEDRYLSEDYVTSNPSWDLQDSPWKAAMIEKVFGADGLNSKSICEVGCGAGGILTELSEKHPSSRFVGYEISPAASRFWTSRKRPNVVFVISEFPKNRDERYDILLVLDVIEHVSNPAAFLNGLRGAAKEYFFHIPLDLSALSVARETPLMTVREKVGHINYYTKTLALELLRESGFDIVGWGYSGAAFNSPHASWKTRLAALPRAIAYLVNKDVGVRIFGGETLWVHAR